MEHAALEHRFVSAAAMCRAAELFSPLYSAGA